MAGGEGAKERRRLKRLAAQEGKNKSEPAKAPRKPTYNDKSKEKKSQYRTNGNKTYQTSASTRRNSNGGGQKTFNKNKKNFQTNNNSKNITNKEKKPKIKKPKHLKRKLELAANENDAARETIVKEIEKFESKKMFYSKISDDRKRQKTTTAINSSTANDTESEDAVSRLNRINANLTPFPRNRDLETSQPTIIEDEDDKMTDIKETSEPKADKMKDEADSEIGSIEDEDDKKTDIKETSEPEADKKKDEADSEIGSIEDEDEKMTDIKETCEPEADKKRDETDSEIGSDDNDTSDDEIVEENAGNNRPCESIAHGIKESDPSSEEDGDGTGSGNSSDESDDDEPLQQRQRGRRRRGRQDTAKVIEEKEAIEKSEAAASADRKTDGANEEKGKQRYCIGRKPVTDFALGQTHSARVVYVKPFGVFFDIGCHSDAFCHVSRLSDDFIKSPEDKFKEGDEVPKVRIVEIDRKQKRITVSLQSEIRIEDERKSIEDRKFRKEKMKQKLKKKTGAGQSQPSSSSNSFSQDLSKSHSNFRNETTFTPNRDEHVFKKAPPAPPKNNTDPSTMPPSDLKRARKLARRAERRAQVEKETQDS